MSKYTDYWKNAKRQYICTQTGESCPFNDDIWLLGDARGIAKDNCPIRAYQPRDYVNSEGITVLIDWCRSADQ